MISVALTGSAINIIKIDGMAPIYGPKNGIIFVMPTITLTRTAYGILNIRVNM